MRCPICQAPSRPRPENEAFPFCSRSCKLQDLGRWLSGDYRIPTDSNESELGLGSEGRPLEEDE